MGNSSAWGVFRQLFARNVFVLLLAAALGVHALYIYTVCDSDGLLLLDCFAIVFLVLAYCVRGVLLSKERQHVDESLFAVLLFVFGVVFMFAFVPGSIPDEPYHFQASYKWSNILLLMPDSSSDTISFREDIAQFVANGSLFNTTVELGEYASLFDSFQFFSNCDSYVDVAAHSAFDIGGNPPQLKVASALGIALARAANLGAIPVFYAGRLANLIVFVVLAYFAARVTPVAKKTFMVVSLLPMTLHLVSSYSYDSGIIGIAFLLLAFCLRAIYGESAMRKKDMIAIAILSALLAPCKVVYSVIVLLVFLIPASRFATKKQSYIFKGLVFTCMVAAILALRLGSLLGMAGVDGSADSVDYRGTESGSFYSLGGILSDPVGTIVMYLRTFAVQGDFYLSTIVGGSLGWFQPDLAMPHYVVFGLLLMLLISALRSKDDGFPVPLAHRMIFLILPIACWLAVMMSMYIGWTFTTESVIQGVQGRYLLPVLPMLLLTLRGPSIKVDSELTSKLTFGMAGFNIAYLASLTSMIIV